MWLLTDGALREKETGQLSLDVPLGVVGTLRQTHLYKLEGKEDVGGKKVDRVSFTSSVEFKPGKAGPALPNAVTGGDLKAEGARGTLHFDAAGGRLVKATSKMTLKGRMVLSGGGTNLD